MIDPGAGDGMGESHPGDVGHADGAGDEVALGPERLGDEGDGGDAAVGEFHGVTHGAGGATASMTVGRDHGLASIDEIVEHRIGHDRRRIALVEAVERGAGVGHAERPLDLVEETHRVGEAIGQQPDRQGIVEGDRQGVGLDRKAGFAAGVQELDHARTLVRILTGHACPVRALRWIANGLVVSLFVVDPGGLSPSGPARFAAVAALLGVGGTLAIRELLEDRAVWTIDLVRRASLLWAGLLGLTALSAISAVDRWHAVYGSPERQLGLVTWIGFAVAFAVGIAVGFDAVPTLGRAATAAVAGLGVLSLAELAGADLWGTGWPGLRVGAPFGQSTFLAVALVLLGPMAVGVAVESVRSPRRSVPRIVASTSAVALGLVALAATQSRGPLVGLGVATVTFVAARRRSGPAERVPRSSGAWTMAAAVLVTAVGVSSISQRRGWSVVTGRVDEWAVAIRGIADRPVLGAGPEGYRATFPTLVDADYVRRYGAEVVTDRAHNALLDTALSSGLGAAALLLGLWLIVARAAWRRMTDERSGPVAIGLAVGVLAALVQQFVLFPLAEVDALLWLGAGMVVVGPRGRPAPEVGDRITNGGVRSVGVALTLLVVGALGSSFWFVATSAIGEHEMADASGFRQDASEAAADRALARRPESVRLVFAASLIHGSGPTLLDLDEALTILERGLDVHPDEPTLIDEHLRRLLQRAQRSGLEADAQAAVVGFEQRTSVAPESPLLLARHAQALALLGRRDEARDRIRRALELDPDDAALLAIQENLEQS